MTNKKSRASIFDVCSNFTLANDARNAGLYPFFSPISQSSGSSVYIHGKKFLMLGSNNYLGLAHDKRVVQASIEATYRHGTSCSGSRFMNGTLDLHEELEHRLASFVHKEAALCFTTGYQTNLGSISALLQKRDHVIVDKYDHASIMDGIFLAEGAKKGIHLHRYKHNDMADLEKILQKIPLQENKLIVVDGVFSMEGDIAPLPAIRSLCDTYNAGLYLDEAHALGVIGDNGCGTGEHFGNIYDAADVVMCTFSKSFGSIGGFVAGDEDVIDYIKHVARPLMFSASMAPSSIASVMKSLDIIEEDNHLVKSLQANATLLRDALTSYGFNIGTSETAIVPIVIGDNDKTFMLYKSIFEKGIYVNPVVSPAVPPSRSLLRTSCMAVHTKEEISYAAEVIAKEAKKLAII